MAPVPRQSFRRRLRSLAVEDFRQFITALWEARGYTVHDEDGPIRVERSAEDTHPTRTIVMAHIPYAFGHIPLPRGDRFSPPKCLDTIDTVVTNTRAERFRSTNTDDFTVIDVDDLYEIALYSIPRPRAETLLRSHLGFQDPFDHPPPSDPQRTWGIERVTAVVLALVVFAAVAGGVVLTDQIGTDASIESDPDLPVATDTPRSPVQSVTTATPSSSSIPTTTPQRTTLAPGVNMSGIFDLARLAAAHREVITGRSYTWTLIYQERYPDRDPVTLVETRMIVSPTLYASSLDRNGEPRFPNPISDQEVYATERFRFERIYTESGIRYRTTSIDSASQLDGRNAIRAERLIQRFLTADESTITDISQRNKTSYHQFNETNFYQFDDINYYTVRTTGDPRDNITNATTVARIDSNGMVYKLRRTHQPVDRENVTIVITFRYTRIGNTSIEQPDWYDTARNATE